ncbi:putative short chain oxidoreductase/dehydrogenase [Aspergillus pseudodeflectus]|uniref:Short chain oxidoreductase/dehydrogenase n=1 Tax=Aspergillus pseudodeflectus TaxID=176178 RepID=A0ABR4JLC8_9EURO
MSSKPVWLITGCSSGFGFSLAVLAAKQDHKVIATSRNPSKSPERVSQLESLGGIWKALDVTVPDLKDRVTELLAIYGQIDVLVNNAAYGVLGAVEDMPTSAVHDQFATNVFGPLTLTQLILPQIRSRRTGTILNVSSVGGLCLSPCTGIYAASKHALEAWTKGLSLEVKDFGIKVFIIEPGSSRTGFLSIQSGSAAGGSFQITPSEPYKDGTAGHWLGLFGNLHGKELGDVEEAARAMWEVATGTGELGSVVHKEGYVRVLLGKDCVDAVTRKLAELQRTLDGEKDLISSLQVDL